MRRTLMRILFSSWLVLAVACVGTAVVAPPGEPPPQVEKDEKGKADSPKKRVEVPKLPPEKLPPLSATPPDPGREQYRREKIYVHVEERVYPKERPAYSPEPRVLEVYLAEYLRRAGFEVVANPAEAVYRFEGSFEAKFLEAIIFRGQTLAHKYKGKASLALRRGEGPVLEPIEIPEIYTEGVQIPPEEAKKRHEEEDTRAVHQMRRLLAKNVWETLYHRGSTLGDPEIPGLISSLSLDDPDNEAPVLGKDILKALTAKRFGAVPYLLDALTDDRPVRVTAQYPGLSAFNADKLRIYHLADKALEEIFQKVSRMDLETPAEARFIIMKGWQNEWKKFCPSYRNSPQAAEPSPKGRETTPTGKQG